MHLICLGVMKRMLLFLKEGPRICRISAAQISSDFARQPRGLHEVKRWKATEFRQFVFYTGMIALKNVA